MGETGHVHGMVVVQKPAESLYVYCFFFGKGFWAWSFGSGKEKAHKHEQMFPVTARVARGLPTGWPGAKSLCAVCGTQGT